MAKAKKGEKQKFDPNLNYQVNSQSKFEIDGQELVLLANFAKSILSKPESREVLQAVDTLNITQNLLKKGVESGEILPAEPTVEAKSDVPSNVMPLGKPKPLEGPEIVE